jgi:phage regulator Rha-like protein
VTHTNTQQNAPGACDSKGLHTDTNARRILPATGPLDQAPDGKVIAEPQDLALTTTPTEARIDSRLLAQGFGNKHKAAMALIERYSDRFKRLGILPFKKAVINGRGQPERYALLNEDQAYLLLSLSRNSDIVVNLKVKLVKAFGNARRAADLRQTEYLPGYHELHDTMHLLANGSPNERFLHINVNKAVNQFAGIVPGQRASAALPQQALLIVGQLVAAKAAQGATDHHDGYQRIKTNLTALQGVIALEMQP